MEKKVRCIELALEFFRSGATGRAMTAKDIVDAAKEFETYVSDETSNSAVRGDAAKYIA